MASGFWVFEMTERSKLILAFVTLFGLFEWLRMSFGLKHAPQIYQRLVDNALYGYLKIGQSQPLMARSMCSKMENLRQIDDPLYWDADLILTIFSY